MFSSIYIERDVLNHPRTVDILSRFSDVIVVEIEKYTEVFNRKAQNFRLQKQKPALILASKQANHVLSAPGGYGIGGQHHYYFSHMLNCLYDCRYCFLQGMYRSANYVLFVNYEEYLDQILQVAGQYKDEICNFYSGYDCDSLALDPVSGFVDYFVPKLAGKNNVILELRTKSTQIRKLLDLEPAENIIVAFSFTPETVSKALEYKVPTFERRLEAIKKLQAKGWKIGVRFDPIIYEDNYEENYRELFKAVFNVVEQQSIHSVSLGPFRLPDAYFQNMQKLYPHEKLFSAKLVSRNNMVTFTEHIEQEMIKYCENQILEYIPEEKYFPCEFP